MEEERGTDSDPKSAFTDKDALIQTLMKQVREQAEHIARLEAVIEELKRRLGQNSQNSSQPPSSNVFVKPKSQRKKSGRARGGQKGHPGRTLKMIDTPDKVVVHAVEACRSCGASLEDVRASKYERRQVFDIPPVKVEVTEHRGEKKSCPKCGHANTAAFPKETTAGAIYGSRLRAIAVYLSRYQLLPYERTTELMSDLFGASLSPATVLRANTLMYENLHEAEVIIEETACAQEVAGFDETGVRIGGKLAWLHVVSTPKLTHYSVSRRRGKEAMDRAGVLPKFSGVAVHDHWKPYFSFSCPHALCNAHHLRELTAVEETTGHRWPKKMRSLLIEIKAATEEAKQHSHCLDPEQISLFERRYDRIVTEGLRVCKPPAPVSTKRKRGRKKQTKEKNLLDRLVNFKQETLAFMYDFSVPFDNNGAERDIRMVKVQQKISGSFRSDDGARSFCRTRGYLSTAKKNAFSAIDAIETALQNRPLLPAVSSQHRLPSTGPG